MMTSSVYVDNFRYFYQNLFIFALWSSFVIYHMIKSSVVVDKFHYIHQKSVHHCNVDFFIFLWDFSYSGVYCMMMSTVAVDNFHYVYQKSVLHCVASLFLFSETSVIVESTAWWHHQSFLIIFILSHKNLSIIALWASFFFSETTVIVEASVLWRPQSL